MKFTGITWNHGALKLGSAFLRLLGLNGVEYFFQRSLNHPTNGSCGSFLHSSRDSQRFQAAVPYWPHCLQERDPHFRLGKRSTTSQIFWNLPKTTIVAYTKKCVTPHVLRKTNKSGALFFFHRAGHLCFIHFNSENTVLDGGFCSV